MRAFAYLAVALIPLTSLDAVAVRLRDGNVYFTQPPRLVSAATTHTQTYVWGATYYFTLAVPENAGEPLQRVAIAQRDGSTTARRVDYEVEDTRAFLGTRRDRETPLSLGATTYDQETQTVVVTFEPPVPPGNTVTIGLRPERNPQVGGVYLFGVTAFPAGEPAYGQFLGFGRLQFDEPDGDFLLRRVLPGNGYAIAPPGGGPFGNFW